MSWTFEEGAQKRSNFYNDTAEHGHGPWTIDVESNSPNMGDVISFSEGSGNNAVDIQITNAAGDVIANGAGTYDDSSGTVSGQFPDTGGTYS